MPTRKKASKKATKKAAGRAGSQDSIVALRRAKEALVERYEQEPWFRGAGIGVDETGAACLRLSVDPGAEPAAIPSRFDDRKLQIVRIERYEPRAAPGSSGGKSRGG